MNVNLTNISTEQRNPNTVDIDCLSTLDILKKINHEDKQVAPSIEKALPEIAKVVDRAAERLAAGGRLIYLGAGTSGRIGVLDSVECPPTFGVSPETVIGLMAGGMNAFQKALEGAEDSRELAEKDLKEINVSGKDIVIGIASSGRTPYVLGGIAYAKEQGALTACITSSANSPLEKMVDLPIVCLTGPEVITGSTRMKSGTAQKMICNMISTSTMIKLGKVYSNFMVDVMATNEKLVARSLKIITDITGLSSGEAKTMLKKHKTIKKVVFAYLTGIEQDEIIEQYLTKNQGHLRKSVEDAKCNMLK